MIDNRLIFLKQSYGMAVIDTYMPYNVVLTIYQYYDWHDLYWVHKYGSKTAERDELWEPLYAKYSPLWEPLYLKYLPEIDNSNKHFIFKFIDTIINNFYSDPSYNTYEDGTSSTTLKGKQFFQLMGEYNLVKFMCDRHFHSYNWILRYLSNNDDIQEKSLQLIMQKVGIYNQWFAYLNQKFQNDEKLVKCAVRLDSYNYQWIVNRLHITYEIKKLATKENVCIIERNDEVLINLIVFNPKVSKRWHGWRFVNEKFRDDIDLVRAVIASQNILFELKYTSERLRNHHEIVKLAIEKYPRNLRWASPLLQDNYELVKQAISQRADSLKFASARLRSDKSLAMLALTYNPNKHHICLKVFESISKDLQQDEDIINLLKAQNPYFDLYLKCKAEHNITINDVKENGFGNLPLHQLDDGGILRLYICLHPDTLQYVGQEIFDNEEIVKLAFSHHGGKILSCTNVRTFEIVKLAVQEDGRLLYLANYPFRDNDEIVTIAVRQNGSALHSASPRLQDNELIVQLAVEQNGNALRYASERLRNNQRIVEAAVRQNGPAIIYANPRFRDNKQIIELALSGPCDAPQQSCDENQIILKFLSPRYQDDDKIVRRIIIKFKGQLCYASDRLKDDEDIVRLATSIYPAALDHASPRLQNDIEIVRHAVTHHWRSLLYAEKIFQDNTEIVKLAIQQNPFALRYASARLRDDQDIVRLAFHQDSEVIAHATERIKNIILNSPR